MRWRSNRVEKTLVHWLPRKCMGMEVAMTRGRIAAAEVSDVETCMIDTCAVSSKIHSWPQPAGMFLSGALLPLWQGGTCSCASCFRQVLPAHKATH